MIHWADATRSSRRGTRGGPARTETQLVIAGLDRQSRLVGQCVPKRDARAKRGHDKFSGRWLFDSDPSPALASLRSARAPSPTRACARARASAARVGEGKEPYRPSPASALSRMALSVVEGVIASGSTFMWMIAGLPEATESSNAWAKSAVFSTLAPKPPKARA